MKNAFFLRILALTIAALAAIASPSQAQNQTATLELGADTVEFGSPVELRIVVKSKTGQSVTPPAFRNNTVIPGVEILSDSGADTAATTTSGTQYTFKYSITSFSDSTFTIPQQAVLVDRDTFYTNSKQVTFTLLQGVDSSFLAAIDTTQALKIFDVKDVKQTPWTFQEFWERYGEMILILLLVIVLTSIITYVIIRKIKNQPIIPISKPREPAEKVALRRLDELKARDLCKDNKIKEFYSEITDILKSYISDRYSTSVMESTSTETLKTLKSKIGQKNEAYSHMQDIVKTADYVKFAKMETLQDENDRVLKMAYEIVDITKPTYDEIIKEQTVTPTMSFGAAIRSVLLEKFHKTEGRARRSEYWWFWLLQALLIPVFILLYGISCYYSHALAMVFGVIYMIWILLSIIPTITLSIRRLHDIGQPNGKIIIMYSNPISHLYYCLQDSERKPNQYGISPKYPNARG